MKLQVIGPEAIRGISDKFLGLSKEVFGEVFDHDSLRKEGKAQQSKGGERLQALRDKAKAKGHEIKADLKDQQQRAAQKLKESA